MERGKILGKLITSGLILLISVFIQAQSVEETRKILRFGLESQLLDTLRQLTLQKNEEYLSDVENLLSSYQTNPVREAVLRYFTEIKKPVSDEKIKMITLDQERWPNSLLLTFSDYVVSLKLDNLTQYIVPLLNADSVFQRGVATRLIGRLGIQEQSNVLLQILKNPETPVELVGDLVIALGRLEHDEAAEEIKRVFLDGSSSAALKAQCLEALSYFDNEIAHEVFHDALTNENAIVRSAAIRFSAGMKTFNLNHELILRGLRDQSPNVRLAAAQALQDRPMREALDMLQYRASTDPDTRVRQESLAAIKKIDDGEWRIKMIDLLQNRRADTQLWGEILRQIFEEKIEEALEPLRKVLTEDSRLPNSTSLSSFAQRYSLTEWAKADELLPLILRSANGNAQLVILRTLQRRNRRDLRSLLEDTGRTTRNAQVRAFIQNLLKQWDES